MIVLSTLHDPEGRFVPLIQSSEDFFQEHTPDLIVAHTTSTSAKTLSHLKHLGVDIFPSGLFGEARIASLQRGLKTREKTFLTCDFDKILHWIRVDPGEWVKLLKTIPRKDYVAYGRSETTWKTYPISWYYPETAINHLVSKAVGFKVDVLTSVALFKRTAAEVIARKAKEKSWGSVVEWFLLPFKEGLPVGYTDANGLSWEDPDRFGEEIKAARGLKTWMSKNYDTVEEWKKRLTSAMMQVEVIQRMS